MIDQAMHHFLTTRVELEIDEKKVYRISIFYFNELDKNVIERFEFYDEKQERIPSLFKQDKIQPIDTLSLGMAINSAPEFLVYKDPDLIRHLCIMCQVL